MTENEENNAIWSQRNYTNALQSKQKQQINDEEQWFPYKVEKYQEHEKYQFRDKRKT